jgi:hypothetical protein
MLRLLHVANGHCTTRLIEAAALPGRVSIWADPLHDGPIPRGLSDEEWVRVRARFHTPDNQSPDAAEADFRQWRAVIDEHPGYDELVLWFEHDLFDQLALLQILSRVGRERPVPKPISLVSINAYPGHPQFKGLGELAPADIAALFEQRVAVTPAQLALAAAAWDVFREQDPEQLRVFLQRDTSALPFLAPALGRYLEERPGDDGLNRSERRLLAQLANGPLDIHAAWRGMHEGERAYYITDTSFWDLVLRLASRSPALIDMRVRGGEGALPHGTLALRS